MKKIIITALPMILASSNITLAQDKALSVPNGPYLGQKPPGKIPELFAPGIVSTEAGEFSITISRDGYEIYISRNDMPNRSRIYGFKHIGGQWIKKSPPLFGWNEEEFEPNYSPDNSRIYYSSDRPNSSGGDIKYLTWYVEKNGAGWDEPEMVLEASVNFVTQATTGNIYFTGRNPKKGIYVASQQEKTFREVRYLPGVINDYLNPAHPYIAPDESYLIYDYNLREGSGDRNLLISYRVNDDWTTPINLTKHHGIELANSNISFVTFDGKYFFFSSAGNIYWMDASFIEELRPKN